MIRYIKYPDDIEKWTEYGAKQQKLVPLNSQHPLTPYCGDVLNNVTFTYPINPTSKCDKFMIKSTKVGVFIGVISSPEDFDKRNSVRQTWASMTR